jgi:hypothetical protein
MRFTWGVKFALGCAILTLSGWLLPRMKPAPPDAADGVTNFQSSFMTWDYPRPANMRRHNIPLGNKARIQIDAWITVTDEARGKTERYVLIAPCRTEWVYAPDHLFQSPSQEYRFIFSLHEQRGMGRAYTYDGRISTGQPIEGTYRSLKIDLQSFPHGRRLRTAAEVNDASEHNLQIVGRTEFQDPKRKERYVLEYPIKTLNFRPESASFQVDTGPLLVPDFQSGAGNPIDRLEMAHVCYNRFDRAEFILRGPVDVGGGVRVLDYSGSREYPARNELYSER